MTISSHPWIKLLIAIIGAIIVRILLNSWGWSIATFFILMFIFIFVASWIFGAAKSKVPVNDQMKELLNKLQRVGVKKRELPINARGWCNILGLYVQFKETPSMCRLQAGEQRNSYIDAWQDYNGDMDEWKVNKYNPGDWEKLVDPTLEIVEWLSKYRGVPEEYLDSFNKAIESFKKEGHLMLPKIKEI
jgi:hypothetical protein